MPNLPGAYLAGQTVPGVVDGTTISGANFIAFGQNGQILVYDGDPATGNLIGSWSGMAGNDSEGNTFPLGLGLQGTGDVFTVIGANGAEIVVQIVGGLPQIVMETGAANQHTFAGIYSQITNPGASEFLSTFLVGAGVATYTDFATIALNSSAIDGSLTGGGQLSYYTRSGPELVLLGWGPNGVTVTSPIASDSNTYQTERLTVVPAGNTTINSAGPTPVLNNPTCSLGTGTYHIRGGLYCLPSVSGGTVVITLAGGGTVNFMGITFVEYLVQPQATPWGGDVAQVTSMGGTFTSTILGASLTPRLITFEGNISMTTSTNFAIGCGNGGTGTYSVRQASSWVTIEPVGS